MSDGRIMALDWGTKRIGVALTDPLKMIARPFSIIANEGKRKVLPVIEQLIQQQNVELIVLGLPVNLQGADTEKTMQVRRFYEFLQPQIDIPVELCDERYTSDEAASALQLFNVGAKRQKELKDAIAAALILRRWLAGRHT